MPRAALLFGALLVAVCGEGAAVETDQYLVWDVRLTDAGDALNEFVNSSIREYLEESGYSACDCEDVTLGIYAYFFRGRRNSRIKAFIRASPDVELYPDRSISNESYRRMSIYRARTFPFFLPMARTLRVGEVYLGLDKVGHFFGFGCRYFRRYLFLRTRGYTEPEAVKRVVVWGLRQERSIVGLWVDGVFSHADLEANYQGMMLARAFCEGESPHLVRDGDRWSLVRSIDLRDYFTPGFDESYNESFYRGLRGIFVPRRVSDLYSDARFKPPARFRAYDSIAPSRSVRIIEEYFEKLGTGVVRASDR